MFNLFVASLLCVEFHTVKKPMRVTSLRVLLGYSFFSYLAMAHELSESRNKPARIRQGCVFDAVRASDVAGLADGVSAWFMRYPLYFDGYRVVIGRENS